jgi:flagellar biogenesis protein FliO
VGEAVAGLAGSQSPASTARLCESLPLGEKRLVAVIQYEEQKFLLGASPHSVALLARLDGAPDFAELLTQWCERQR